MRAADDEPENEEQADSTDEVSFPVRGTLRLFPHLDTRWFQPQVPNLSRAAMLPVTSSITPLVQGVYEDLGRQLYGVVLGRQLTEPLSAILTSAYAQLPRYPADGLLAFNDFYRQWTSIVESNLSLFAAAWDAHGPENWASLDFDRHTDAEKIMSSEGIPLVWVPRAEIVEELCDAPDFDDRCRILQDRSGEIMQDCRTVLADLPADHRMSALVAQTTVAIEAYCGGFAAPAQSHAANILDSALRNLNRQGAAFGPVTKFKYARVSAALPVPDGSTTVGKYRGVWVLAPIPSALTEWYPYQGDPVPTRFSRHATAHALDIVGQHSLTNAIVSIMLVTSLLREAHESGW